MRNKLMAVALWVFVAAALLGAQQAQAQAQDPRVTNISITAMPSGANRIQSDNFVRNTATYTEILSPEVTLLNLSVAVADVFRVTVTQSVDGVNTTLWNQAPSRGNFFSDSRNIDIPLAGAVDFIQVTVAIFGIVGQDLAAPIGTYTINIHRLIWCMDEDFDPNFPVATAYMDSDSVPQWADIDKDDDGLIEICDLEGLDRVRYASDGSGYQANMSAAKLTSGCASSGCRGYELVRHLDFLDDNSYRSTANKVLYTEGAGWDPINQTHAAFTLEFDGNRYTIANLMINRPNTNNIGLFSEITVHDMRNIGLINVNITGSQEVGGMFGDLGTPRNSTIDCNHCYVVGGTIRGTNSVGGLAGKIRTGSSTELDSSGYANVAVIGTNEVGGLIGDSGGILGTSNFNYAAGTVTGRDQVGGLIGRVEVVFGEDSIYHESYSTARVTGDSNVGGFAGFTNVTVGMVTFENNYWDVDLSAQRSSAGEGPGAITSLSTVQMLAPTAPGTVATDAYYNWDPTRWDFGTDKQYPALKYTTANTVLGQSVGDLLPFQRNKLQSLMLKANGAGDDLISNFSPHRMEYVVEPAVKPNTVTLELAADEERHIVNVVDAEGTIIPRGVGDVYTVPVDTAAKETLIQVSVRNPSDPIEWFETQYSVRVMSTISGELSELEIEEGTTQTILDVAAEDKRYALEVGYAVESIKLTPRAAAGARINLIVGDTTTQVVVSGEAQTIALPLGETTLIRIEVEGSVESTTYLLSVFRSTAAVLSELALSVGDLDFAAEVDAYTVAVANTVTSVAVMTATALDSQATVEIYHGTERVDLGTPVELAEGATTELRIEVALGDLMRTYMVSVTRAASANADLAEGDGLVLTGATLQPSFEPTHTIYTASVLAVDSVVVSAKAAHSSATIVVRKDSTEVEADNSGDYVIDLTPGGATVIAVEVTAQDEMTVNTYSITVAHDRGSGTSLTQVILRNAAAGLEIDLSSFYSDESAYTTTVEAVLDLTLSLEASIGATLDVSQGATPIIADENGDYSIELAADGMITVTITVTAGDGGTADYTLNIVHRISSQALLRSLELRRGDGAILPLIPHFEVPDSASAETSLSFDYEASVEGYRQLEMEFSLSLGAMATVSADGGMIAATDEDSVYAIDLLLGETTTITIVVISQDEKRQTTYTLVIKHEVDEETGLQSLRVVDLAGDAVMLTTRSPIVYDARVSKETQVDVLVEASGVAAELLVTVAEETLVGENGRYAVDLAVATTTVLVIKVTAQSGSRANYTIRFKQEADGDANLRKLEVRDNLGNALRLVPAFMAEEVAYQSTLSGATHVIVRAAVAALRSARGGAQVAVATLRVNGVPLADDTPSEPLELELGTTTTVVIEVRAQDGTTKAYVVAISQVLSAEADLTALSLVDDLEDLVELADFDADREQYEIELVGTSALRLMPRASAGANIVVRAAGASMVVASDGMSPAIELNLAGVTTITIVVTAQDQSSSKTYILIISQIKNDEALLDDLSLRAGGMALQLVPEFSTATFSYATTVTAFESVLVMPRASLGANLVISSSEASTSVEVMNNQASALIDLRLGATTTLVVRVTSQDESSTTAYSVVIRHYLGRDAILENLEFEPPGNSMPLTPEFASHHTTYTIAYFDLDATHLRLSASVGAEVVLRVNGEELAPQEQLGTYLIDLTRAQEIMITVRAQAVAVGSEVGVVGETQNTYMIMLSRTTSGLLIRTRLFLEAPLQ